MIKNKKQLFEAMMQGKKLVVKRRIPFSKYELDDGTKVNNRSAWSLIKTGRIKEVPYLDNQSDTYYEL